MQLEQSFVLPMPPEQAWAAFQQVELLVECLPGAALTGPAADGVLPLRFEVKLGPIAASFTGSGQVHYDEATRSGRFEGGAADRRTLSRVKGAADFAVAAAPGGARVDVRVEYQLTGALAQFGRAGIVRELGAALTAQFAAELARRLSGAEVPDPDTAMPPGQALQAWPLLKQAVARRLGSDGRAAHSFDSSSRE